MNSAVKPMTHTALDLRNQMYDFFSAETKWLDNERNVKIRRID